MTRVLLLHPGAMGASVGAALARAGHETLWVSGGRSAATRQRAEQAGLRAVSDLAAAASGAEVAISVCPPEAAAEVARAVTDAGFVGTFVDANAISPATATAIGGIVGERFVDGGIIGPPAWRAGVMRLYLSGERSAGVAALFAGTPVDARALPHPIGAASALKMCYAAYTKGSSALLLGVRALAQRLGITDALLAEWALSQPSLEARSNTAARNTSPKAWRFEGEMREIAATCRDAKLPDGFHAAAAEVYARMAVLKTQDDAGIDDVIAALTKKPR